MHFMHAEAALASQSGDQPADISTLRDRATYPSRMPTSASPSARFQSFSTKSEGSQGPKRLAALRALLKERGLQGFLVARADEHQNEYLPASEERLAWLTGFTGSAGFAIVLSDRAAVFSDGRYTEQLAAQIDASAYEAVSLIDHPPSNGWRPMRRRAHASAMIRAGIRSTDCSASRRRRSGRGSSSSLGTRIRWMPSGATGRRLQPRRFVLHDKALAGVASADKITRLAKWLRRKGSTGLRSRIRPVSLALQRARRRRAPHAAAHRLCADAAQGRPQLFLDGAQAVEQHPRALEDLAEVGEPATLEPALATLGKAGAKLRFDRESASAALVDGFNAAGGKAEVGTNPIALMKAVKNEPSGRARGRPQIRDGAAMARFLCWLDREAPKGKLTEISAAVALEQFRSETGEFEGHLLRHDLGGGAETPPSPTTG